MRKRLITAIVSAGLLFGTTVPAGAADYYYRNHYRYERHRRYVRHRRRMETAKRVGIGAAGGAVVGGLIGGGAGAAVGAAAGAGAGELYNRHEKHTGHY
jgi:outer membrane lipoprotein SlyB